MGNIVLLDDLTINKIAAGEVIERPASVVKEMVENSIDAGATSITVEIKNGGISFIKVSDNGKGIAQDDLEIAFERHATSKIRSADDLNKVTSMGFRGEALASIAAVANVELVSKTAEQETGYKVVVEAGNVLEKEEAGCRTGTTITVRNLFFNTPVRYKFLKKDYTESGYIEDVITRVAFVNPNIAIKLINTGKTVIQTNGNGQLKDVIYSIFGKDIANAILEVSYQYEDIKVTGVIGKPEIARSNRANQLFFVNKRYIKDKTLTAATEQSYKGLIPIGKFGFVVLNIEMDPSKVDVNVHPAKLEVRFQEENKIFQAIYHAIKDTLLKSELVSEPKPNLRGESSNRIERTPLSFEERLRNLRESKKENQGGGLFSFRKQNEKQIEENKNKRLQELKTQDKYYIDLVDRHVKETLNKFKNESLNVDIDTSLAYLISFSDKVNWICKTRINGKPDSFIIASCLMYSLISHPVITVNKSEDSEYLEIIRFSINMDVVMSCVFEIISEPSTYFEDNGIWVEEKHPKVNISVPNGLIKNSELYQRILNAIYRDELSDNRTSIMQFSNLPHLIYLNCQ